MTIILFTLTPIYSVNPYDGVYAGTYSNGLNPMVASLAAVATGGSYPTISDLSTALQSYLPPLYFPATIPLDQQQQLDAIVGNIYNAYIDPSNPALAQYSPAQMTIVNQLLQGILANRVETGPTISFANTLNYITFVEENISTSDLSTGQQAPLFMATANAKVALNYFYNQSLTPSTNWGNFISSNPAINIMNLPTWINSIIIGTLIGATQSIRFTPTDAESAVGVAPNIITSLAGALTLSFGLTVLGWVQRPLSTAQIQLNLSRQTIANLTNWGNGMGPLPEEQVGTWLPGSSRWNGPRCLCASWVRTHGCADTENNCSNVTGCQSVACNI